MDVKIVYYLLFVNSLNNIISDLSNSNVFSEDNLNLTSELQYVCGLEENMVKKGKTDNAC